MSLHSMSLHTHPPRSSLLKAKMYHSQLNPQGLYVPFLQSVFPREETKISVQSNHAALANTSTTLDEKQVLLQVFVKS